MSAIAKKHLIAMISDIETADEQYEAAGFVLDCIIADGACDDPLGNSASLKPLKIARAEDGAILAVLCQVGPHGLKIGDIAGTERQVLVTAP
ncbi:MAG: hypothetical protein ACYDFS_02435 [Vulcanimicrobiaceae bacterium]